jgi:hypothetical protein
MNRKVFERKRSWLNLRYYPDIYLEGLMKTTTTRFEGLTDYSPQSDERRDEVARGL